MSCAGRPASSLSNLQHCQVILGLCPVTSLSMVPTQPWGAHRLSLPGACSSLATLRAPAPSSPHGKEIHSLRSVPHLYATFCGFVFYSVFNRKTLTWGWLGEAQARMGARLALSRQQSRGASVGPQACCAGSAHRWCPPCCSDWAAGIAAGFGDSPKTRVGLTALR